MFKLTLQKDDAVFTVERRGDHEPWSATIDNLYGVDSCQNLYAASAMYNVGFPDSLNAAFTNALETFLGMSTS